MVWKFESVTQKISAEAWVNPKTFQGWAAILRMSWSKRWRIFIPKMYFNSNPENTHFPAHYMLCHNPLEVALSTQTQILQFSLSLKFDSAETSISDESANFVLGLELVIGEKNYNIQYSSHQLWILTPFLLLYRNQHHRGGCFSWCNTEKNIQKLSCLEYVFQMSSFKWL